MPLHRNSRAFLSFCAAAFVEFLLLNKDNFFFMLSHFSLTAIDSHGTLYLALGSVGKQKEQVE